MKKSQHISLIITPTFASENDYTQTFSRKAFRPLFFRENHTEKIMFWACVRATIFLFLRLNSNF
jgi:hypothetical protein